MNEKMNDEINMNEKKNKINLLFDNLSKKGEKALICYIVGGYPDVKTSKEIIKTLIDSGADIIEIVIPFSDPMADGPTIQKASSIALSKGITPSTCFEIVNDLKKTFIDTPFLFMTYSNIVFSNNLRNFLTIAKKNNIDGFIIPDLNVEESQEYVSLANKLGLATIFLSAPNTPKKRLLEIASASTGFVYMVSVFGITGTRFNFEKYTFDAVSKTKEIINRYKIPLAVGFGISNPSDGKNMLKSGADGIIIASSLMKLIMDNENDKAKMLSYLSKFISELKAICK
ncbi:MAG TPA: tryptophan synthase subunit alpha [Candidatus Nitrosocosmicus sp.]